MLYLHDKALREYGGVQGVKDEGLLQSALGRPLNKFAYADPGSIDTFDLATAYAYGLATNHAFNDGNKRTAWSSCVLFLKINGLNPRPPAPETLARVLQLVNRELDEAGFAAWLRLSPLAETAKQR